MKARAVFLIMEYPRMASRGLPRRRLVQETRVEIPSFPHHGRQWHRNAWPGAASVATVKGPLTATAAIRPDKGLAGHEIPGPEKYSRKPFFHGICAHGRANDIVGPGTPQRYDFRHGATGGDDNHWNGRIAAIRVAAQRTGE